MHFFQYKNGILYCEGVRVDNIARRVSTPFYLYSRATLERHYREFDKSLKKIPHIICYAYKSNSNLTLCKILANEGCGADVVSLGELMKALQAGVSPNKIVFNGNGKTDEEIEVGLEKDILMFNVDSFEELARINRIGARLKKKARIALRINPDVQTHTHPHVATGLKESKFGIPYGQAEKGYNMARRLKWLKIEGIHMHIGSQITETEPFVKALKKLSRLAERLRKIGIQFDYVNVGGGLGIVYLEERPPTLKDYADSVISLMKKIGLIGLFEPGRVIVGNAGILVTKVITTKKGAKRTFLVTDAAMSDLFRPSFYDAYHEIKPVHESPRREKITYDIVGPICESADFIAKNRKLTGASPDELLAIFSAGAYGFSMSSNYNARMRAPEVLVDGKGFYTIRKRETYDDLVRGEMIPEGINRA